MASTTTRIKTPVKSPASAPVNAPVSGSAVSIGTLVVIDKALSVSVYLQVANGIIAYIRQGVLKPGASLPPSRVLAKELGVHRKTIIAAYDELCAQNWTEVYPRKGIFVARNLPDVAPRPVSQGRPEPQPGRRNQFFRR